MYSHVFLFDYAQIRISFRNQLIKKLVENPVFNVFPAILTKVSMDTQDFFCDVIPEFPNQDDLNLASQKLSELSHQETFLTDELLASMLCLELGSRNSTALDNNWLMLRRRFEVSKRVWTKYSKSFKKASADYTQRSLYAMLSAGLGCQLQRIDDLRILNALLKINDTLISTAAYSSTAETDGWTLLGIEAEIKAILKLQMEKS